MLKGIEYNKECRIMKDRTLYAEERKVLSDFLASENENVRLEYGSEREAKNSWQALYMWIKNNRKPLKVVQRKNFIFAIKTIED